MRHSMFCNNMRKFPNDKTRSAFPRDKPNKPMFSKGKQNKIFSSLDDSVNEVLKLYEDSPSVCEEIIGTLNMYRINVTIARELKSLESEKKLTAEFSKYIKNLKNKKVR